MAFDAPGVGGSPTPLYPPTMRCLARTVADLIEEVGHDLATTARNEAAASGETATLGETTTLGKTTTLSKTTTPGKTATPGQTTTPGKTTAPDETAMPARMDVLGLSWGGALSQELAFRHPERVRRLVLAATTPGVLSVPGNPAAMTILASPARYYVPGYLRAVAPILYGKEVRRYPDLFEKHVAVRTRLAPDPVGYTYQIAALRRWSSLPWLGRLPQRTLVLAGDDDGIVPLANSRLIARLIPDGRLHVERGGGHLFLLLRAARIAPILENFLDAP